MIFELIYILEPKMVIIHHKMRTNMAIVKMDEKWDSSITIYHMDILINIFLL